MFRHALLASVTAFFMLTAAAQPVRSGVRIATSGDTLLVVWNEDGGVFGSRLTTRGVPLDRQPVRIADGRVGSVVWTGSKFLLLASDGEHVSLVDLAGKRTRLYDLVSFGELRAFDMAISGNTLLVTTNFGRADLFDLDGNLIRERGSGAPLRRVAAAASGDAFMTVVTTSNGFLVYSTYDVNGTFLNACCGGIPEVPPEDPSGEAAATDGTRFLVVTTKGRTVSSLVASRTLSGPISALTTALSVNATAPRAAWHGSEYLVTFIGDGRLHAMRISNEATPIGSVMAGERVRDSEAADVTGGAVAWIREDGQVRVGLYDAVSLAAGAPFYTITDVTRAPVRRRAVR